jgi:hypothetical protein
MFGQVSQSKSLRLVLNTLTSSTLGLRGPLEIVQFCSKGRCRSRKTERLLMTGKLRLERLDKSSTLSSDTERSVGDDNEYSPFDVSVL